MSVSSLRELFDSFPNLTALIVGDVMIDSYLWGKTSRISPEAPVPVVNVVKREKRLGGAANVALNVQALGATPLLCSVIGDDKDGAELTRLMTENSLSTDGIVTSPERITTIKHRVISSGQHVLRIDSEMEDALNYKLNHQLIERYTQLLPQADVVIFEDYDKGVLNSGNISELIRLAHEQDIPTIVDPKKKNFLAYKGVCLFKPNLKELREGLKIEVDVADKAEFEAAVQLLRDKLQADAVLVTLSEHGVYCLSDTEQGYIPAHLRSISDVSGAGDTVVSIAALCLALETDLKVLAALANMGGGLVCEQIGVIPIDRDKFYIEAAQENLFATTPKPLPRSSDNQPENKAAEKSSETKKP